VDVKRLFHWSGALFKQGSSEPSGIWQLSLDFREEQDKWRCVFAAKNKAGAGKTALSFSPLHVAHRARTADAV